jgi:aldose sugar dehydrogenase
MLLNIPAIPVNASSAETSHNGGKVVIGPDKNVYLIIGDVGRHQGQAQNVGNVAFQVDKFNQIRLSKFGQLLEKLSNSKKVEHIESKC